MLAMNRKLMKWAAGLGAALCLSATVHAQGTESGIQDPARDGYYKAFKGKRVVFVPLFMGLDLTEGWSAVVAKDAAANGYKFEIRNSNWNTAAGARTITSLISEKPDVIMVQNPDVQPYAKLMQEGVISKEQAELVQEIASGHGGNAFEWASTPEERTRLWTARHNAYFAAVQSRPGCKAISTDTCVPISRLADCLLDSVSEANASGIPYFLVGHVGDGNFHFGYLLDPHQPEERVTAEKLNHQLVTRALNLGGTCTGEHGIGLHKMDFLVSEAGDGAVNMMRTIKRALDPHNIMNPGKIFSL